MKYNIWTLIKIICFVGIIILVILNMWLIIHVWKCLWLHLPDWVLVWCALGSGKQELVALMIYLAIPTFYCIVVYYLIKIYLYLWKVIFKKSNKEKENIK